MLSQAIRKQRKVARGAMNSIRRRGVDYNPEWWERFYAGGVSDRQTISRDVSATVAAYHYASVETLILAYLLNHNSTIGAVLDIGSGSGHWIDFYRSLDARSVCGVDIARSACDHLERRYANDSAVTIRCGAAIDALQGVTVDLVNAIGVMFHIVDDAAWADTIHAAGRALAIDGTFIVGGHFGWLDGVNVQIDSDGWINKRLRSKRRWFRVLKAAGFSKMRVYRNRAHLRVPITLPENNVLVATK